MQTTSAPDVERSAAPSTFLTVQALRAIAALMVVAYHAFDMWALRVKPGDYWTNGAAGVDISL